MEGLLSDVDDGVTVYNVLCLSSARSSGITNRFMLVEDLLHIYTYPLVYQYPSPYLLSNLDLSLSFVQFWNIPVLHVVPPAQYQDGPYESFNSTQYVSLKTRIVNLAKQRYAARCPTFSQLGIRSFEFATLIVFVWTSTGGNDVYYFASEVWSKIKYCPNLRGTLKVYSFFSLTIWISKIIKKYWIEQAVNYNLYKSFWSELPYSMAWARCLQNMTFNAFAMMIVFDDLLQYRLSLKYLRDL